MRPEPVAFDDLLGSLADGTPIDWAALEAEALDERMRRRFRNLRLVARVAELHRSQPLNDDVVEAPAGSTSGAEPPAIWGRLQVRAQLASGAYGAVYRAYDPHLDRDVALKLLRTRADGTDTVRLLAEAQALAKVSHQNVVIIHGADVHEGQPGLWTELIDGETLATLTGARGRLGASETIAIGRDVCCALSAIHAAGLVHGDVKTQNVMRESGGRIVLMDFGAGRRLGAAQATAGTPLYLAPEVLAGGPPTPQADLYSLGVLMFTLLSGRYPYEADDLDGLRRAHADGAQVYLRDLRPDLPATLVDAVERAIDPDPARRFATAGAMERALSAAEEERRHRWLPVVLAALVVAAGAVGVALLWPRAPQSLAVLSFTSTDPAAAYLVNGLNRDVVRELQRYDVHVRSAAGASRQASAADLEARLNAESILSGDARINPAGVSITVGVHKAGSAPFWTQNYDVPNAGLPSLAGTIARDVAAAVGIQRQAGAPPIYQPDPRAYDAYLRGRLLAERREQTDLTRSLEYFKQALTLDPGYAEAWTGLADSYLALAVPPFGDLRPLEARRLAREALANALAINGDLAEAETSLAWAAEAFEWNWTAAERHFKRAISLNPKYALAHHWYSMLLTDLGRFDEALAELRIAQSLEPASILIQRDFGWIHFMHANYDEAVLGLRETLARDPGYWPAITLLARSLAARGDYAEALAELERARPDEDRRTAYLSFRAYIEAAAGDPRARQTLAELQARDRSNYVTPYYFALIYTALGQRDDALAELQRAHAEQDITLTAVNVDPRFASLRTDVRFQALVSSMRFPASQR